MVRFCFKLFLSVFIISCSSPFLKHDEPMRLSVDDEMPDIKVKEMGEDPNITKIEAGVVRAEDEISPPLAVTPQLGSPKVNKNRFEKKSKKDMESKKVAKENNKKSQLKANESANNEVAEPKPRAPTHESNVGFPIGSRRPERDPFRVGEKVTLSVRYFKAEAGELTLEVKPMVEVNGRKSYRWYSGLQTTGMFSRFYSVEDSAETLVDFETLVPSVYTLQVKESAQLKNGKGYFDTKALKAVYAEKKYTEKKGHEEKHQQWQLAPYSQNVFSAAFYMRVFTYEVGKEFKFYVSDNEKNMMFKGKALRKERIETDAGSFNTIVIKPEFEVDGVFKPVGDIFFWLTDDDRKFIVRIESEIKIGTLVMDAIKVELGN